MTSLNTTSELIEEIRQGRMVILMDDEDRENEGDLIMASACVRPEDINFMARYGRGLICLTLTRQRCQQLHLPLIAKHGTQHHTTNFTVTIDAAHDITTGISASDRAKTIMAAVAPKAKPEDLVQPGHIYPIMAQPGGVLTRAGHTEAGCDLARLAGFEESAVIVEILNEDGSMSRRADLEQFAKDHNLKIGTVADLISYRLAHEHTIERVSTCDFPTQEGTFTLVTYQDQVDQCLHLALIHGTITPEDPVLVRVHLPDTLCDLLGGERSHCRTSLQESLRCIAKSQSGILILLRQSEDDELLLQRIEEFRHANTMSSPMTNNSRGLRTYGIGAQILRDLKVGKMRVLGTPKKMCGLSGFGLEVVEYVESTANCLNRPSAQ